MSSKLVAPSPEFYDCLEKLKKHYSQVETGKYYYLGQGCCVKIKYPTEIIVIDTKFLNEIRGLTLFKYTLSINSVPTYDQATVPTEQQDQVASKNQTVNTCPTYDEATRSRQQQEEVPGE